MTYNVFSGTLNPTQSVSRELRKKAWTDWDAVWNAESGGSREHVLDWDVDAPTGRSFFEVSGQLKSIVKRRILGVV